MTGSNAFAEDDDVLVRELIDLVIKKAHEDEPGYLARLNAQLAATIQRELKDTDNARFNSLNTDLGLVRSDVGAKLDGAKTDIGALGDQVKALNAELALARSDIGAKLDGTKIDIGVLNAQVNALAARNEVGSVANELKVAIATLSTLATNVGDVLGELKNATSALTNQGHLPLSSEEQTDAPPQPLRGEPSPSGATEPPAARKTIAEILFNLTNANSRSVKFVVSILFTLALVVFAIGISSHYRPADRDENVSKDILAKEVRIGDKERTMLKIGKCRSIGDCLKGGIPHFDGSISALKRAVADRQISYSSQPSGTTLGRLVLQALISAPGIGVTRISQEYDLHEISQLCMSDGADPRPDLITDPDTLAMCVGNALTRKTN